MPVTGPVQRGGRARLVLWGALVAFPLGACSQPVNQFFILQNQVEKEGCVITTDESPYRAMGHLDVRLLHRDAIGAYLAMPLVQNDLPEDASSVAQQNRIDLRGFIVDVQTIGQPPGKVAELLDNLEFDNPTLLHFREPASGSIGPGGDRRATSVVVIGAALARMIQATGDLKSVPYVQLGARIRAVGNRATGEIESDPFLFPIRVCDGCLIARQESCPFTTAPSNLGNACNVAQDAYVDCCTMGDSLICPPPVAAP